MLRCFVEKDIEVFTFVSLDVHAQLTPFLKVNI